MRPTVIANSFLWIFAKITQDRNRTNPENHLWLERGGSGPHGFSSVAGRSFAWIHQKSSWQQCSGVASSSYLSILQPALMAFQKPRVHMWEEDTRYVMQKDRASCSWCAGGGRGIDPRRACTQCGHSLFFPGSGAWYLLLLLHSHIISTCPLPTSCHPLGPRPLRNRYSDLSSLSSRFQG